MESNGHQTSSVRKDLAVIGCAFNECSDVFKVGPKVVANQTQRQVAF